MLADRKNALLSSGVAGVVDLDFDLDAFELEPPPPPPPVAVFFGDGDANRDSPTATRPARSAVRSHASASGSELFDPSTSVE